MTNAGHEQETIRACEQALAALRVANLRFRPMVKRQTGIDSKRKNIVLGRTNLKTGLITIDIYTPKFRKPKKISSILRTLCHEVAHHQKKPYRQRYKGRIINRIHYPEFYRQVQKNIIVCRQDCFLAKYF